MAGSNVKDGKKNAKADHVHEEPLGKISALTTYFSYAVLILIGHLRDFLASLTGMSRYRAAPPKRGYATLLKSWESFFTRRLYHRLSDCWNRPITTSPGVRIDVMERVSSYTSNFNTLRSSGRVIPCINLASYNYLGFADDWHATCKKQVCAALEKWPLSMCSSRMDFGTTSLHETLENEIADFIGKEAAIVYSMGYGTNTATIATLVGKGGLIISDSLNHTSIVNGSRNSQAMIRVFRNNDTIHLEEVLREAIIMGQPKTRRPWTKIMVMVEGIYSMEGIICNLPEVVRLCKKYRAYLYVDEAHSIGALGKTGRGVCEHTGVDPKDIDILMGTFSKSFAGMGGYIAASKDVIDYLKAHSSGLLYHNSLSPIVAAQVLRALRVIRGQDGTNIGQMKLDQIKENANFFRKEMERIGVSVVGDYDSPVVPILIYHPAKIAAFSRECLKRGLAVVVVGFPATSVIMSRARFCISSAHTREDLEFAVKVIDEVSQLIWIKYERSAFGY